MLKLPEGIWRFPKMANNAESQVNIMVYPIGCFQLVMWLPPDRWLLYFMENPHLKWIMTGGIAIY